MNLKSFTHNYKLKAIALGLAWLTWYIVTTITNFDKVISNVNLVLMLPEGWAVLDKSTDEFQVTFRGTKEDLLMLDERSVQLFVDLRNEEFSPTKRIRLTNRIVTHNSKARVYELHPAYVELRLGREGSRRLPVRPTTSGEPAEGMRLESVVYEPTHVTLFGAEDRLDAITSLQTQPVNLADRVRSFEQRVDVLIPSQDWIGRVEPSRVTVRVNLAGLTEDRVLEGVPVRISLPGDYEGALPLEAVPQQVSLTLKGRPELLDELTPDTIYAFAPVESGRNEARVIVHLPAGVELLDVRPRNVALRTPPPTPPAAPSPPADAEAPQPEPTPES